MSLEGTTSVALGVGSSKLGTWAHGPSMGGWVAMASRDTEGAHTPLPPRSQLLSLPSCHCQRSIRPQQVKLKAKLVEKTKSQDGAGEGPLTGERTEPALHPQLTCPCRSVLSSIRAQVSVWIPSESERGHQGVSHQLSPVERTGGLQMRKRPSIPQSPEPVKPTLSRTDHLGPILAQVPSSWVKIPWSLPMPLA